jgi:hypothetical protein
MQAAGEVHRADHRHDVVVEAVDRVPRVKAAAGFGKGQRREHLDGNAARRQREAFRHLAADVDRWHGLVRGRGVDGL